MNKDELEARLSAIEAVNHALTIALSHLCKNMPQMQQSLRDHIPHAMDLSLALPVTEGQRMLIEQTLHSFAGTHLG